MTERTINEAELRAILDSTFDITETIFTDITDAAFPPLFTPKKGEIIVVSDSSAFTHSKIRVFSHMNVNSGKYECFRDGERDETDTNTWVFAKPQTPTERGEG
jgi:hypothetical protein